MSQEETTPVNSEQAEGRQPDTHTEPAGTPGAEAVSQSPQSDADEALIKAQKQAQEYLDGWQRERAEFNNYRRRMENQLKESHQNASLEMLTKLLPIVDDFERALANLPQDQAGQSWLNGVALIHRKFQKIMEEYGVAVIDPVGEAFDPNRHEAVGVDDSADGSSGHVTQTLQKGYAYGDRVLRPALVRVAR